jgi:hypothetical protein
MEADVREAAMAGQLKETRKCPVILSQELALPS